MVAIKLRFVAGRFHATPWGRHVNEGAVEWPPSPWRLFRSLIATWRRKRPAIPEETMRSLLQSLTDPPEFALPPATVAHTRHYMRRYKPGESDMVFDTFVRVEVSQPVLMCWPDLVLPDDQAQALRELLRVLGYFGRAESWVEAELLLEWDGRTNCCPTGAEDALAEGGERVQVIAAQPWHEYDPWRQEQAERAVQAEIERRRVAADGKGKDPDKVKLTEKQHRKCLAHLPEDAFAALHAETTDLRKQGWNSPPGSRMIAYALPPRALEPRSSLRRPAVRTRPMPTVARFALAGPVLPRLTDTVYLAETMRQALMSWSDGAEVFAGKDENGTRLEGHKHAFVLPADDDGNGRLDHITVYCRSGFDGPARMALSGVHKLWQAGGRPDLHLVLVGLGEPDAYGGHEFRAGQTPQLASSRVWLSRTPFLLTRHPKRRKNGAPKLHEDGTWIDGPEDQLRRALVQQGYPQPTAMERIECTAAGGKPLRWLAFARERRSGRGALAGPAGYGFRVEFAEPVSGPVAAGYACHFGLGQFVAATDE